MARSKSSGKGTPERKSVRMEARVTPSARKVIERATALSGMVVGDLAYEGAMKVLDDYEHILLRGADAEAFLNAISEPPAPAKRLIAALRKHAVMSGERSR